MVKKGLLADLAENHTNLPTELRSLSSTVRADGRVMIDCSDSVLSREEEEGGRGGGERRTGLFSSTGSLFGGLLGKMKGKI